MIDIFILDMGKNWFINIFRWLFAFLDFVVYSVISILFRTIFNLANFELVGFYEAFEQRVYVILGIFMLFKVTVSLITYLVNPDKISDKEQGIGKIVTRIIMVLVMLIALPTFFSLMTEFQNKLLPVIPRVIVGTANTLGSEDVTGIADNMSLTMIQGFAHRKDGCAVDEISNLSQFLTHINDSCSDGNKTIYAYDYLPIVSTIVGALGVYVLFSLCITVAIRAFKMIILRMIAPVPIISYVDPKSSKDGAFSTWTKTLLSTWGELFILIGMIYFIVYMIDFLLSGEAWKGFFTGISNPIDGALLLAFLFIGLLFFAKQAPQFFFDALGIKTKGTFMRMLGMGATALGMGGNVASQFRDRNVENPGHSFKNFGASLFSGLASGLEGGHALLSTDKPTWHTGTDQIQKSKAIASSRIEGHSTLGGRLLSGVQSTLGIPTRYETLDNKIKAYNSATDAWKRIDTALNSDDEKLYSTSLNINGETIFDSSKSYSTKDANDILERMKSSGKYSAAEIEQVENIKKSWQKTRFNDIRVRGASGADLYGTEAQIFAGANTIFDIGKKYSRDDDHVFADFGSATSVADLSLEMGPHFKGVAYNAGRQAEVIKASPEYRSADADAKRQNSK